MQLVDVERLADVRRALVEPGLVMPGETRQVTHDGTVRGTQFRTKGVGVSMVLVATAGQVDAQLIGVAFGQVGHPALPEVTVVDALHLGLDTIVMQDGHTDCSRGKRPEHRSLCNDVRTKVLMCIKDLSGIESLKVHKTPPTL